MLYGHYVGFYLELFNSLMPVSNIIVGTSTASRCKPFNYIGPINEIVIIEM